MHWADTPQAFGALFLIAVVESSVFPIPPDVLLIAIVASSARLWIRAATLCAVGSVLGAAGAVEAIFSVLAIREGVLPPTINLDEPDEGCDLDFVASGAREADIRVALSNSFGFGGTNGTLIFQRFED